MESDVFVSFSCLAAESYDGPHSSAELTGHIEGFPDANPNEGILAKAHWLSSRVSYCPKDGIVFKKTQELNL